MREGPIKDSAIHRINAFGVGASFSKDGFLSLVPNASAYLYARSYSLTSVTAE